MATRKVKTTRVCGVVFLVVGQPWIKKSLGHYGSGATKQGPSKFISTQFTGPVLTVTQLGEEVLSLLGALEVKIMVFAFHNYVRVPQVLSLGASRTLPETSSCNQV